MKEKNKLFSKKHLLCILTVLLQEFRHTLDGSAALWEDFKNERRMNEVVVLRS